MAISYPKSRSHAALAYGIQQSKPCLETHEPERKDRLSHRFDRRGRSAGGAPVSRSRRQRFNPRSQQRLEQIRAARGSAVFVPADFSSLNEVRRLADVVRQECDCIDVLINNAGIGSGGSAAKRET